MAKPGLAPRRAAVYLLNQVTEEGRLLSELLPKALDRLEPDERARAQRLATDTLRWMDRADRMLGPHLKKRPRDGVMNVLRLGVVELAVEGAAAHAVVDAGVTLMRESQRTTSSAGLVNAVLRKVAQDLDKWPTLPVPRLAKWLRGPLISGYGKKTIELIEAAHAQGAPLDLTARTAPEKVAEQTGGTLLPTGSIRLQNAGQVSKLPGFAQGDWWVQDAAAAIPAQLLQAQKGEHVLDMCAAPGGKTLQLAAAGAGVTALDISEGRMARVAENLGRTGLIANCVVGDVTMWQPETLFDAILLDAPCSATGTIRRHPDLPYAKDGSEFMGLFALQETMIDRAVAMLKPGGRLIYCTCSLLPDEGEVQVEEALSRHTTLSLDEKALDHPWIEDSWRCETGLRLRPDFWADIGGMDGFFIAALQKAA